MRERGNLLLTEGSGLERNEKKEETNDRESEQN